MTKTAKHCKTRGPSKTNQNQPKPEWRMGMGQSISERISLQALCASLHIWAPQTVAVSQYEASAPAVFVRVASPQCTTNFYYFQLFSIHNDMQIWNDHHASPPKGSKNKGTLRNFLICTAAWEPFCHFGSTTSWPDRPLWAACTRWRRACRDTQSPAQDSSCTIKTWQSGAKFDIWCYNMELKDRHFWLLVSWVL